MECTDLNSEANDFIWKTLICMTIINDIIKAPNPKSL